MRKKHLLYAGLALMLIFPTVVSYAGQTGAETAKGKVTSKDEVVYATLKANGEPGSIYVVNTLDVAQAGEILDYGPYRSVKNLTDVTELEQEGQNVRFDAPEGKFYYQGNMEENRELPWEVTVSYFLDGRKVEPSELAGESGHVKINITTAENNNVDSVFYDNYLLQVSMLVPNTYQNLEATDGMIANVGKNKQVTFTVMPGKEEELTLEADVTGFEFQGVEIAAIPSSLPIDTTGTEGMTEEMTVLSDAIGELNNGVADLQDGASQLNQGAASLSTGSEKYKNGMSELSGSSSEIVSASSSIREALRSINQSLSEGAETDLTSLTELPAGLKGLADGLTQTASGLTTLQENYSAAYNALDGAINEIPGHQLSEEEINALYESGADSEVLDKLVASYTASQKVKGTYGNVHEAFAAVEPSLNQVDESVIGISGTLSSIAEDITNSLAATDVSGLSELQKGMETLSSNYNQFHSGLVSYTDGVDQLASSYLDLHSGLVGLTGGTRELAEGVGELQNGTDELYQETKDLPDQMEEEINSMIQEYDKSDFEPVSFVSSKNEKVSSVQFVIKTESIKIEEKATKEAEPEKKKGFWELFKALF
ncbi:YhgE/Pip domain-containing protein [Sutcliffiella deserti]|uniref:YhgE/Pip domain-containing protein n=1 Tax=Sutcliffiella deserti TaxID=2875501 RepID=UPI001CBBD315|nr:YhgE/Pip domain-containing protein [Sutcliffiella deserti]